MTDKETLFLYRIGEAEETLADGEAITRRDLFRNNINNRHLRFGEKTNGRAGGTGTAAHIYR